MFSSIRPSVRAALELGTAELQEDLDAGLAVNVGELIESLRLVGPETPEHDLGKLARTFCRVVWEPSWTVTPI